MCTVKLSRFSKFDLNPRGNLWVKDDNRFGHKMLSKMGWSQGKGLGKHEDGIAENIKVRAKIGNTGVGWNDKLPLGLDTRDYDALLENLNKKYHSSNEVGGEIKVKSLEQRSQQFKNRLHYQKFIKGKDVCRYSEKDMKSIFVTKKTEPDEDSSLEKSTITNTDAPSSKSSTEESLTTFKSQLSINDYFKMKMEQKLSEVANGNSVKSEILSEAEETPVPEVPTLSSKKRKKELKNSNKSKKIKLEDSNEICEFNSLPEILDIEAEPREDFDQSTCSPTKSKKQSPKKSKKIKLEKLKHLKSCLKSAVKKIFSREKKEVSFCDRVSYRIIPGISTDADEVMHMDADNELEYIDDENVEHDNDVESIGNESDDNGPLIHAETEDLEIFNADQNKDDDNAGDVESTNNGTLSLDDSVPMIDIEEESSETPECLVLPKCDNSNYNSWLESQRIAAKMKLYKNMMKKIKKHPVLRKTNLLDIKGYGNWGF